MATLKLFCNNPSLNTLKAFVEFYKLRVVDKKYKDKNGNMIGYTLDEFFEYNRECIFSQLSSEALLKLSEKKGNKKVEELTADDIDKNIELPCPSYLYIQDKYVNYSLIAKHTNFQESTDDAIAFEDEVIKKIIQDDTANFYTVKCQNPGCRVIGWFKSMYYDNKSQSKGNNDVDNIYDSKQNFWDITPFIESLNTSVSETGGTFTFSLPHIPLYPKGLQSEGMSQRALSMRGIETMSNDKGSYSDFFSENDLVAKSVLTAFDYFEWLIQHNDLIFISFDKMEDLTNDELAEHTFDMIGLVDSVTSSKDASGNVTIDVSGRDLMKLISEDASIFFPTGVSSGTKNIFDNTETVLKGGDLDSVLRYKGAERVNGVPRQLTGMLNIFAAEPNDFSIDFVLKTVVSHLANMSIVPDDLFSSWGDKRTRFSMLQPKNV